MPEFTYRITVSLQRESGKFASKAELDDLVRDALREANPGSLDTDAGATYTVEVWDVD